MLTAHACGRPDLDQMVMSCRPRGFGAMPRRIRVPAYGQRKCDPGPGAVAL